jgi:hypothetical protein
MKQRLKRDQRSQEQADRRARPRGGRRNADLANEEREERAKILAEYATKREKSKRR